MTLTTLIMISNAYDFMLDRCFKMLICGPSGSGKINVLLNMNSELLFYDKIYIFGKNLEQPKYTCPINKKAGYNVVEMYNNEIIPVSELSDDNQKIVVFDDFVCEKKIRNPVMNYFISGRHKKCSVIYQMFIIK